MGHGSEPLAEKFADSSKFVDTDISSNRSRSPICGRSSSVSRCSSATFSPERSPSVEVLTEVPNRFSSGAVSAGVKQAVISFDAASDSSSIRKPNRTYRAIEVFCGHAGFTKALNVEAVEAIGIDYSCNKDKPESRVLYMDLTTKSGVEEFWAFCKQFNPDFLWFAPPCGTASRAREIRRSEGPDPKPLRSDEFPDGISGLEDKLAQRVWHANLLYWFVSATIKGMESRIGWAIENPSNSLMWKTSWMVGLMQEVDHERITFQACMHGGGRDKRTDLVFGGGVDFHKLAVMCDKKHKHLPWGFTKTEGVFATGRERCYPKLLCSRMAKIVAAFLGASKRDAKVLHRAEEMKAVGAGKQPRRGVLEVIPEHCRTVVVSECSPGEVEEVMSCTTGRDHDRTFKQVWLPKGSKLLSVEEDDGGLGLSRCKFGIAWAPEDFVSKAVGETKL